MSSTPSTAHRRDFCRALYLQPSNQKLDFADTSDIYCRLQAVPTMSSTPSTAHRRDFCRALYLQPSNQKLDFANKADIYCRLQAVPTMSSTLSTAHLSSLISSLSSLLDMLHIEEHLLRRAQLVKIPALMLEARE